MNYNANDKYSIEEYARNLMMKSLNDLCKENSLQHRFNKEKSKGRLGQVIEENYFGYKVNSKKEADFKEAGIELKVAPIKKVKAKENAKTLRGIEGFSAKERIVLSIIDFMELYKESWDNNTLMKKCGQLLLMFYIYEKGIAIEDLKFRLISLWEPAKEDLKIIKKDWETIVEKIKLGKAHEISEGDTMYLGACTKGSTAEKSKRDQPFSDIKAPQRAFSLKRSYVDFIIEELLQREQYRNLKKEKSIALKFKDRNFDEVIIKLFKDLEGKTLEEIMYKYNIQRERKAKNFNRLVVDDICKIVFGDKLEKFSEFKKANIEIKTILLKENGVPKESMSFEQIDYCNLVKEEWDDSEIKDKFENKKQLWIIFKAQKGFEKQFDLNLDEIILEKVMFWNIPIADLEGSMKNVWHDTVKKINKGIYDNFIKIKDNEIAHIRPKAQNNKDVILTPQGTYERKMCFWLNAKYIKEQIEKED